ncbi:MAG TPA: TetR/AcrR family transcriptional regulator [Amycolatopsis sp.]|uniref:TetR/AcrR family transcriptional regulator n=1 Tax=Amycolatopsis sp. TaxID=37632 RepID=UPI002B4A42CE|nr:TetR/AcrR family transcriptional regulator [Amycolatopsis sp.]HKS47013.1 TetR/AcrR family transcriptional regulator [Amycolatopsis sp.]
MQKRAPAPKQKPAQSSGNRRNPYTHKAIIKATLDLLKTVHYHTLTIESIAAAAGVGKATVYRWWPSKGALVAEAISSTNIIQDPPDTGDIPADLLAAAKIAVRSFASHPGGVLITALATDLVADPELLQSFVANFIRPRRTLLRDLLQRAIDEGFIAPNVDPDLIMDMWAGAVIYRKLMAQLPVDDKFAAQLVDAFLLEKRTGHAPDHLSTRRDPDVRATPRRTGARAASAKRRNSSGDSRRK